MPNVDVVRQLRGRFLQPLDGCAQRRIVIWHDPTGEFAETFGALAEEGFGADELPRPVRFVEAADGNLFETKRLLNRGDVESDILLYRRRARGELEGDWLADVELYAEHFQADFLSLLVDELGVADNDEVRGTLRKFAVFFKAKDRRARFARFASGAASREDVALRVIAVIAGAEAPTVESVTRALLAGLAADEHGTAERFRKLGALDALAAFLDRKIGYRGDVAAEGAAGDLAAHLLVTAASCKLPPEALTGLDRFLAPDYRHFCLTIVHAWMATGDGDGLEVLYDLCRQTEEACGIADRLRAVPRAALEDADVLPCIDEVLIAGLMDDLARGSVCCDEAARIVAQRKSGTWGARCASYYAALSAAVDAQRFHQAHITSFHEVDARAVWEAYTSDWLTMDAVYRRFCQAFDACLTEANLALDDSLKSLADQIERLYANFLTRSNGCWTNAAQAAWAQVGYVEGIPRQRRFYDDVVPSELSGGAKRVVVAVSDALRYEVAQELSERLERETRGVAKMGAMQGTFPSITPFGMAALLPHHRLQLREEDGTLLVDGLPAATVDQREAVLRARNPKSRALRYNDLQHMKSAARKELAADAEVIYVYHDAIDKAGEGAGGEREVFDACEDALQELVALVKIAVNDLGASRVVITADHGFLCTRSPLGETDHVSASDMEGSAVLMGRRHAVLEGEVSSDVFIHMNMDDVDGGTYTGLSPRSCLRIKRPGPGENYVHGGVSLQELVVPVVRFRNVKTGAKGFVETQKAQIKLLSSDRRITSNLFTLEFLQTEPASGKVTPAVYEVVLVDAANNEVSDVRTVAADSTAHDARDRKIRVSFALKAGHEMSERETYSLVAREKDTGRIAWRDPEGFQVMVAFGMVDDFGF